MALSSGNKINISDIINYFNATVVEVIKAGAYHVNNIPTSQGFPCIDASVLDNINNIPTPYIGSSGQKVNALSIYNGLVSVTRNLTRMGSFTHVVQRRYQRHNEGGNADRWDEIARTRGKAFFTTAYIRELTPAPSNSGVAAGGKITAGSLQALCASCLSAWQSTPKHDQYKLDRCCHDDCYNNCHSNCHSSCRSGCYSD